MKVAIKNLWRWALVTNSLISNCWIEKLLQTAKIYVGFSGGLDSTVLLHAIMHEPLLKDKLCAVHINHGLNPNAYLWQQHCKSFCDKHSIELMIRAVKCKGLNNIEHEARVARFAQFSNILESKDCIVLAHHENDQAETLLLQILRGSGINGLAAMPEVKKLGKGYVMRPFLNCTKDVLEDYAKLNNLLWIDDDSNCNEDFSRNYLRHKVMPVIQQRWPNFTKNFATTATNCQKAKLNLLELAYIDCPELKVKNNTLSLINLTSLSKDRLTNVLKVWLENNDLKIPSAKTLEILIKEIIFSKQDRQPLYKISDKYIRRYNNYLYLVEESNFNFEDKIWDNFPHDFYLPDNYCLQASKGCGLNIEKNALIEVRFRRGGEEFYWKNKTCELKKLLQSFKIPTWKRNQIPLIYINNKLAQIGNFAISDMFYTEQGYKIIWFEKARVYVPAVN